MVNRKWLMVNFGLLLAVFWGISACRPAPSFPARNVVESSLPVQLKWQAQVDEQVDRLPVISEEVIAVATDTALYGFDKESGARLWRHEFRKYQPSPVDLAANDNIVVYGDKNGLTEALRLSSGEVLWRHYPCYSGSRHSSSIVVANEVVYAAYSPTAIEAREIESGDRIWQQCSPTDVPSRGAKLFLDGDDLYVITSAVHILNAENGEITWSTKLNIAGDDDQLEN